MQNTAGRRSFPLSMVIMAMIFFMLMGSMLGGLAASIAESSSGISFTESGLDALISERNWLRLALGLGNIGMFLFSGIVCSIFLYRRYWLKSVDGTSFGDIKTLILAICIILASPWLVYGLYHVNSIIPLPDWASSAESEMSEKLKAALYMDSFPELFFCLFIVAVIPAIGEEWIFRGILQKHLSKNLNNGHWAVWITAILFSAIHFQFEGFLPRMVMGAVLGYIFWWSGSLWLAVLAHFCNNAIQVVGYYISTKKGIELDPTEISEVIWWQPLVSGLIVVGLLFLLWNNRKLPDSNDTIAKNAS